MTEESKNSKSSQPEENPLMNILINVLAPVLILSWMSKEEGKFYHLGPMWAMLAALALPVAYFIYHFVKYRKANTFSIVGILSVLLTGLITLYIWSDDSPEHRAKAALFFGMKEAIFPLILGSLFLITHKAKTPMFNTFIYNDGIFEVRKIESIVQNKAKHADYNKLLWTSTLLFFGSFLLSSGLNLAVAFYYLSDLDPTAIDWKIQYNDGIAKITGIGALIIAAPLLIIGGFILFRLINGLKKITDLELEQIIRAK